MAKHSKSFPPSGSWMICSQWESDPTSSPAAEQGTLRHYLLLDVWARARVDGEPVTWPTTVTVEGEDMSVSSDDVDAVKQLTPYLDNHPAFVNYGKPGYHVWIEQRVNWGAPCQLSGGDYTGTADLVMQTPDRLEVYDAKFGRHPRSPFEDTQLKLYTLGAAAMLDWMGDAAGIEGLRITIGQPYVHGEPQEYWDLRIADALPWVGEAKGWVAARNTTYTPGDDQCHFCKKAGSCTARAEYAAQGLQGAFTDQTVNFSDDLVALSPPDTVVDLAETKMNKDPTTLDDESLSRLVDVADMTIAYLEDAKAEAGRRLMAGKTVGNWKMVAGRRSRAIVDRGGFEESMNKFTGLKKADLYETKLKSLYDLEKVVASKCGARLQSRFEGLWEWKDGKPTLAPKDDPKPAVNRGAITFEDVGGGDAPSWL